MFVVFYREHNFDLFTILYCNRRKIITIFHVPQYTQQKFARNDIILVHGKPFKQFHLSFISKISTTTKFHRAAPFVGIVYSMQYSVCAEKIGITRDTLASHYYGFINSVASIYNTKA
jgi:hypothetical protein